MPRPRLTMIDGGGEAAPSGAARRLVVHVLGSRPDAVTLAPVYAAVQTRGPFEQLIVHAGQRGRSTIPGDLLADVGLPAPDARLHVGSGPHGARTAKALASFERLLAGLQPAVVVVSGASDAALGCGLAAVKLGIPVARVEAGLREHDWSVPEEVNRVLLDRIADLLFAPSAQDAANLAHEGIPASRVHIAGSTAVDTVRRAHGAAASRRVWESYGLERGGYVLVTLDHVIDRDDERRAHVVEGLAALAKRVPVVLPLPARTRRRLETMGDAHRLRMAGVLCGPSREYVDFISLQIGAGAIVTDSGTVQEEASALGVRCFTLRECTERIATLEQGTNTLLGDDARDIADIRPAGGAPTPCAIPLWDGHAGRRVADALVANYAIVRASGSS